MGGEQISCVSLGRRTASTEVRSYSKASKEGNLETKVHVLNVEVSKKISSVGY